MRDAGRTCLFYGSVQRRPQQADLDEVVEVTGLQRSVLAVVAEGQQFLLVGVDGRIGQQRTHCRSRENRRGRAPTAGAERCELCIVTALTRRVGDAATQTEAERRRHEPRCRSTHLKPTHRVDGRTYRELLAVVPLDPRVASSRFLDPLLGDPLDDLRNLVGPRTVVREVEVSLGSVVGSGESEDSLVQGRTTVGVSNDRVVLLAAFPAEDQRQEHTVTITGNELLCVHCEVPTRRRLERCVNRVATGQELVQAERKDGEAVVLMHLVADEQLVLDRLRAQLERKVRQGGEVVGRTFISPHCSRRHTDQARRSRFLGDSECGLDPPRQRIRHEVVSRRRTRWRSEEPVAERRRLSRVATIEALGRTSKRLADHILRKDLPPEQHRSHLGDLALLLDE